MPGWIVSCLLTKRVSSLHSTGDDEEHGAEAVVAVACERDLASGIRDIRPSIVVVGIPNVRREGPCRNTEVDVEAFEGALRLFK